MKILEIFDINLIIPIHNFIFGQDFPYESYQKKREIYPVYIYAYFDNDKIIGYSTIIDQKEKKNLYAWYGGVLPECQGKGITKKFLDIMVQRARDMEYDSITLATTNSRPHMISLAVKYGFDIYDIKQRDGTENNKLYFIYKILPETTMIVDLYPNRRKIKAVEMENLLIQCYKKNCTDIVFTNILSAEDSDIIEYCVKYCQNFIRKPRITVNTKFENIKIIISNYNN